MNSLSNSNTATNNQVAILTGATGGLGIAIAKTLNAQGWKLVLHGRSEDKLASLISQLQHPENATFVAGDIADRSQYAVLRDTALNKFGAIHGLVNNAGIFTPRPFLEVTDDYLDNFINTNYKSTFYLTQAVLPDMLEQGGGSIINIGSVLVDHAIGEVPTTGPISIKGAIHTFSRQLAAEFGKQNIRVNTIAPGIIRSPMHVANGVEDDSMAGLHLVNRIGEGHEIASVVAELLTNSFISGATINVDGGHVAGHHLTA